METRGTYSDEAVSKMYHIKTALNYIKFEFVLRPRGV